MFAAFKILWPEHRRVGRLFRDHRYRQAVTIIQKQVAKESGASFVAAVKFLESQGIHRDVAEENLERMVGAIAVHPNASQERSSHGE